MKIHMQDFKQGREMKDKWIVLLNGHLMRWSNVQYIYPKQKETHSDVEQVYSYFTDAQDDKHPFLDFPLSFDVKGQEYSFEMEHAHLFHKIAVKSIEGCDESVIDLCELSDAKGWSMFMNQVEVD